MRVPTDEEIRRAAERVERQRRIEASQLRPAPPPTELPKPRADALPLEPDTSISDVDTTWLPTPVYRWVEAIHESLGVPRVMAVAAALCAAASLVQGKVRVRICPGWEEPLSLYWIVFSPTGTRKSALMKLATAPIRALQAQLARDLEPEIRRAKNEKLRLEAQCARLRRGVKAHAYTEGAQEHLSQLRELEHELGALVIPAIPRWLYDDINPTVVPRKLRQNQEAEGLARLAVLDAEGTFLANLLGRHSGSTNVDVLLKAYGGEPVDMVRAVTGQADTNDVHIESAHLTMLLMVQPHYLDALRAEPLLGTNGFMGRCLLTQIPDALQRSPWAPPSVPQDVQDGYARWLATLNAIEPGTVWEVPQQCQAQLERIHESIEDARVKDLGGAGWLRRALGRACRILALSELSELSDCQSPPGGVLSVLSESAEGGIISKLDLISLSFIFAYLPQARVVEPPTSPLPTLARRCLRWFRQSKALTVGSKVSIREICRGLTVSVDAALEAASVLVLSGHLEVCDERRHRNKTTTVTYIILSLDSDGSRSEPMPLPALEPDIDQAEPDEPDLPPEDL